MKRRAQRMACVRGVSACALVAAAMLARNAGAETSNAAELEAHALAALRAAADAQARGDDAGAASRFDAVASHVPELADHAAALAAQSWLAAKRAPEAEASVRRALERTPDPVVGAVLFDALARARVAQGDAAGARAAWREALARGPTEGADAARLALAESLAGAGEIDLAAVELRTLWVDAAGRSEGEEAGRQLAVLEARLGRPLRGGADWVRRGDQLFERQRSEDALAAYESALAARIDGADRSRAQRRRADCLFRLRRYREAESAFAALGADSDARVWRARSLARADRVDEAIAQLDAIGGEALGAPSAWARYLAGLLHEGRGKPEQARALFAASLDGADEKVATQALWRLGWSAYTGGDRETARQRFRMLAACYTDPLDQLAARYWAARSFEGEDAAESRRELSAIAAEYPFSYYGWRAAARSETAPRTSARAPIADGAAALAERDLFAARVLVAAGLHDAGLRALQPLAARAANVDDRIAVGRLYAAAGDHHRAQTLVVGAYAEALARGVAAGQEPLWQLAWPDAFAAERRRAQPADARVDPWFVASILREESGYRPDVVSVSGALGLLQLMPDTATRLARDAGIADFSPSQLVRPELNLRLGTLYLDRLARRFDGVLEAVAASYNAGPEAVAKWRSGPPRAADEWVEAIPYDETRGYTKRVLRTFHVYRTLHR